LRINPEHGVALTIRLSKGNRDLLHAFTIPHSAVLVKPYRDFNQALSLSMNNALRGIIRLSVTVTLSQQNICSEHLRTL